MSFQLGRPPALVTLALGTSLALVAAAFTDFLVVVLEAGLLVEVGLVGEPDTTDMDDNNVEGTVQYTNVLILGASTAYQWLCRLLLLIGYHNASTRRDT